MYWCESPSFNAKYVIILPRQIKNSSSGGWGFGLSMIVGLLAPESGSRLRKWIFKSYPLALYQGYPEDVGCSHKRHSFITSCVGY